MSADRFDYEMPASRVIFGPGRIREVVAETDRLGAGRLFLIAGRSSAGAEALLAVAGDRIVQRWDELAQHVPYDLAERARQVATAARADCLVSIGGGSATGLAKAIALTIRIPIVAVPTTYACSELTAIYGLTDVDRKQTGVDPGVRPVAVVYDPELTVGLPPQVTGPSVFNALAHCVGALWSPKANPVTTALALEGVRELRAGLAAAARDPSDLHARARLQFGAFLAGSALAATGPGLHHRISHVLGGRLGLVHADTHSVVLPHVVALNATAVPELTRRLSDALGDAEADAADLLRELARDNGIATDLASLGVAMEELDGIAADLVGTPNPVPVTPAVAAALLRQAVTSGRPVRLGTPEAVDVV